MAASQASSRLEMLQARFQQKQLQEKEQKLLQLYDQQQQRAYQVVQRGSAGSNSSNHGSTATRTTSTTHTTSTSQGGKVRQMFDERRQTTVKGIDRSYPLEPLENKSRKQTNTNSLTQRNGNSIVNRQSVNVKRVTRADVNSNVNGGKPVVSYHEEILRESFGPSVRRHDDEDEYGVENRVATFANGYYRHEADNEQEEILDRETAERNRMMAKIHLMGYDESLKHPVRNDLENEEFPEYLMVDVPDRLPKRNVTKKLSQAEARLERFKNANAKRSNMPKQLTSTSNVIKKRSEQTISTRSNSGRSEIAGTSSTGTRSGSSRISDRNQRILENVKNFLPTETRVDKISKRQKENSNIEIFNGRDSSQSFFKRPIRAENTWIYPRKASNGFKSLTADGKIFIRRSMRPQYFCKESERSGTIMSIDRKSDSSGSPLFDQKTIRKQSKSPHFFLSESERSRTISESKSPIWNIGVSLKRSTSPQYFHHESKQSETTVSSNQETIDRGILKKQHTINSDKKLQTSLDRKTSFKLPLYDREILKKRNTSPQFFSKESEQSGTTMSIDRKSDSSESPLFYQETLRKSPHFFFNESEQSRTTSESKSPGWEREISSRQSTSPQYLREFKRSETAMSTDRETKGSESSEWNKEILIKRDTTDFNKKLRISDTSLDRKTSSKSPLYEGEILKKRSISPQFFCKESERSGTTMSIDHKINKSKSPSYNQKILKQSTTPILSNVDRQYDESKSSETIRKKREKHIASPQFFCKESEKSATTMLIEPRSSSSDSSKNILKQRSYTPDVSYKRSMKPLLSVNKINSVHSRRSPNPSIVKHETKKSLKKDEIPSIVTESRRSSRISETSAASTNSIVSLKYGLEFDNILQSAGLVRKFIKSQNGKQREVRKSPPKQNIKNVNASIAKNNQLKNRYKTSSPFQKASSPFRAIENRKRATPESPRKSITPTEVDMEIQEIIMTDHRIEHNKLQKVASPILRPQIDGTYTKFSDKTKFKTSYTYPVRKIQKQRASILKSNVFKSKENYPAKNKGLKNYQTYRERSKESAISLNKLDCNPVNKISQRIITRPKQDENRMSKVKTSQTQEQTWSKSVKNQADDTAFPFGKHEDRQYSTLQSSKQTRDRSTEIHISKAKSPDSSRERKYSDDIVLSLRDPEERSGGTRTEFDQLRNLHSARLVQDSLKEKNLSASDECNRKRTENKNEDVAVNEVDAGIDVKYRSIAETALNEEIKDYRKITRPNSTDQSSGKNIILQGTRASSNTSKETKKEYGIQHDIKSRISPRITPLRKTAKISHNADASKILPSQRVASKMNQNSTSKFLINTVKGHKNKSALIAKKSTNSFNKAIVKYKIEKSEDTTRELSKILTLNCRENKSEKDFERMDSVESALKRFDSIGVEYERSGPTRASPEISLQMMDVQTKSSVKQAITPAGSTLIPSEITDNTVLKSTAKSPVNKDLTIENYLRKNDLKISSKKICSSKKLEKRSGNTSQNKKSTQTRSPTCKRRLFESDSGKEIQDSNYAKMRKKENYSPVSFRFHKNKEISKFKSSKKDAKESKKLQEMPMFSVKPLRSIEDIRKSIDNEANKIIPIKESRSAIANRRSVSRQDVDARRSISATDAAKNVFLGDDPARLTKAKSCVSRIMKSPSPDSATRKHHETNTRATRGSAPSSPSKSPDIASKYGSAEPKNQEAKPLRKSAIAKGTDSTGSKAATVEVVDTIDDVALQNGSLYDSTTKKSDAFMIDFDDQSAKEGDLVPSKKSPQKKSSSNKQQTVSSASERPTSSVSSNSSASLTHGQVSSTKNKMTTRTKAPTSGGSQTKGPFSARSTGNSADNLVACKMCGRTFADDRIGYHEKVCVKVVNTKRKKFDAMTFRIKGTELEPFAKKSLNKKQETKKPQLKSDWRRKHEDFINTIRSAKQLQAHMAAGGNLKDFPPPPPSDTSDYIQCPHCNRKFNQAAAERHIPKCETMLHNKPAHLRAARPRR
ncbi:uncharacterized protein [Anoplolepis gracilipes]|uniref:uncharacterized protein isoform X2 n=1 Tax=Anoplolepis gracilipes TaxID=354296 RepID=UPI003BA1DDF6